DNLFEWHFTIQGPPGTDYEGGRYHGRILLPPEYPMKPPSIVILTPNGRFELNQKICLSASAYHPEMWQASWGIRTMLLALVGFMPTDGKGTIGSLDCTPEARRQMAIRYTCTRTHV
ncbi:PREDICTED: ubiquitin-conjugating enzyme E2 J1-like, partial [Amphimedon queenslandica]|uniref:UBC core domain-containing protein n=1 Tax=Amphimedon queenslandica TaxID=400682 RepID=A0AAN0IJ46_AMPQE